jgi:ATP-binding cassette, subfamily C (CFTR/MRP), member 1
VAKYFAAAVPFVAIAVYIVQVCYLRTSRQVRLLDIEARAPLFTNFLETTNGITTIRAFGWESYFEERAYRLLNGAQKPFYALYCIQQWLVLVLSLIVGAIAVILVATTTSAQSKFSPGSIGVALNLILTFNQSLTLLVKSWTLLETSIGAVARVKEFVGETPSEERPLAASPPLGWPSKGSIEFLNISIGDR